MVGRWQLAVWRWLATFHDRLHTERDVLYEPREFDDKTVFTSTVGPNVTYTSSSVHYQGVNRRKDD